MNSNFENIDLLIDYDFTGGGGGTMFCFQ